MVYWICKYHLFTETFTFFMETLKMNCVKYRNVFAKIRLSTHQLNIETGCHWNDIRNGHKCTLCEWNDIEEEYHYIIVCPAYTILDNNTFQDIKVCTQVCSTL